jgi:hypothetical protein
MAFAPEHESISFSNGFAHLPSCVGAEIRSNYAPTNTRRYGQIEAVPSGSEGMFDMGGRCVTMRATGLTKENLQFQIGEFDKHGFVFSGRLKVEQLGFFFFLFSSFLSSSFSFSSFSSSFLSFSFFFSALFPIGQANS